MGGNMWAMLMLVACGGSGPDGDTEAAVDTEAADTDVPADTDPDTDCSTVTWYRDLDQDGYGTVIDPVVQCEGTAAPAGYIADATDCNDTDASIHPGGQEVCDVDDLDEDCDGAADDADDSVDPTTQVAWYDDSDHDGYGWMHDSSALIRCNAPTWTANNNTDCDDHRDDIHPGAPEACTPDGGVLYDENCNGFADEGC